MRFLPEEDERLAWNPDPAVALQTLRDYVPADDTQAAERVRMIRFVLEHDDALQRSCIPGHLTASALVLHADGERALFTLHAKLGRWLQLGGHCDGDANLAGVALREAREESGIVDLRVDPTPIDLDIHTIPARPAAGEPEHLHLDTRFFIRAPEDARPVKTSESKELAWFTPDEIAERETDDSVLRLVRLAFEADR